MNRYLLVLSLLTAPLFLSAQQGYSIYKGTVTDRETNETLPYVHIAWSGSQYGTVANEEGAFQIKIPDSNMGDTMVFSFMGYEPYYLPATKKLPQNKKLRIALAPATQELSMIEVSPVDAKKVVQATIKNIPKNYTKRPFLVKGFFRESGIREDTGREFLFAEGVILTHKNQHGDIDRGDYVSLLKGYRKKLQYDLRVDGQTYQLPQVTQGAYIGVRLDIVRDPGFFLSKKRYRDYEYEYERTDILNGKQIYVIRFYPKEGSKQAWLKGLLFVEKEQYAVVKASYEYTKSARAYYNKSEAADILKLQQRKFEAAYFQYKGKWFLKNARIKTKYTESWTSVPLAINMDFIATAVETNIKLDNDKQNIKLDTKNIIPYNRAFAFNERLEKAGDGFWGSDNILERLQQPNDKTEMQNIDSTLFSINIKTTPALPANEKEPAAKTPKPVPQVFLLPEQSPFEKKMENYYLNYLPEKVFVHTDKNIYAGGETIWMAIYLMDGRSHRPGTYSNLVRVELHNAGDEVVAQQNLLSEDGHTSGQFDLPADIVPGEYQLTAFTNYQRNSGDEILFKKTIRIIGGLKESGGVEIEAPVSSAPFSRKKKEKVRLRFFPEGGDCLNGHLCKMALIAENASGRPMQINAVLRDGEGQEVNEIKTGKNGMGSFIYLPVKGKEFYATIEGLGKAYDIPPALDEGFHLGLQHLKQEVRLSLKTNRPKGLAGARITVHLRGRVLIDQALSNKKKEAVLKLPKADLEPGVYVATLFNGKDQPVAERLFFISPKKGGHKFMVSTRKKKYAAREKVEFRVSMNMANIQHDSLAKCRASISVLPESATGGPPSDDIRTWLLLNSDLSALVPNAGELIFNNASLVRDQKIDLFLLTRGWRQFRWEMCALPEKFTPEYLLEKGIFLRGRMGRYSSHEKARQGTVILTRPKIAYAEETKTDENGHFIFGPYTFHNTIDVLLQGRYTKNKKKDEKAKSKPFVHLEILPYDSPKLPPPPLQAAAGYLAEPEKEYAEMSQKALTVARNYDSLVINLDVVDITAKRILAKEKERKERTFMYGGRPDSRLDLADIPGVTSLSVFDLLRKIPGVRVSGGIGHEWVEIRGQTSINLSSTPSFFVDGNQVDINYVRTMQTLSIDFIDVIRGNRAAFLGSGGTNGALLIYTKQGPDAAVAQSRPGLLQTNIYGFHKARRFPVFDPSAPGNQNRPDLRTTVYWNADLRIGTAGSVVDAFTTSDQNGRFIIIAQGLRQDGRPFYGTTVFEVE